MRSSVFSVTPVHAAKESDDRDALGAADARVAPDNHVADVVGQPAVCVRDIRSAFHHEDLRIFIQPAQAGRARRATGHSADDDGLHHSFPFMKFVFIRGAFIARKKVDAAASKRPMTVIPARCRSAVLDYRGGGRVRSRTFRRPRLSGFLRGSEPPGSALRGQDRLPALWR